MGNRDKLGVVDEGQSTENKVQGQTCQGRGRRMSRERSGRTRGFPRDEMPRRTEGQVHTQRSPGHSTLSVTGRWLLPSQHWAEVKCKLPSALPLPLLPNHPLRHPGLGKERPDEGAWYLISLLLSVLLGTTRDAAKRLCICMFHIAPFIEVKILNVQLGNWLNILGSVLKYTLSKNF